VSPAYWTSRIRASRDLFRQRIRTPIPRDTPFAAFSSKLAAQGVAAVADFLVVNFGTGFDRLAATLGPSKGCTARLTVEFLFGFGDVLALTFNLGEQRHTLSIIHSKRPDHPHTCLAVTTVGRRRRPRGHWRRAGRADGVSLGRGSVKQMPTP
jgi:hypothetical protein